MNMNIEEFKKELKKESLKELVIEMGYIKEDEIRGSMCKCVFHNGDRTPSLQITDNFFKCYGCNSKGDIIKWVQLYDGLGFFEAVDKLAKHLNMEITDKNISDNLELKNKLNIQWNKYIESFNKEVKNNKVLLDMSKRFFPLQSGYDPKENRIVLPVMSKIGQVLGFTKRRLSDNENEPKWKHSYLNDSLISQVHNVFNLNNAYKEILNKKEVLIVEGPGDVGGIIKAGFNNVIAVLGTSNFSNEVLDVILPVKDIVLVMDGDKAGIKANNQNILTVNKINPLLLDDLYIVDLPEGKDPGDATSEEIVESYESRTPAIQWFIKNNKENLLSVQNLYHECKSEIIKPQILKEFCNQNNYSLIQGNEMINFNYRAKTRESQEDSKYSEEELYHQQLLAVIGKCEDINVEPFPNITQAKAKRILKLKFKEEY